MATSDRPKPAENVPTDLLPVIRKSGILSDRQYEDIKAKVLHGEYPFDPKELADRLINDELLTDYQAQRLLKNKPNGLAFGKFVILDRVGAGSMGRVYKAQHSLMGRTVALKIIAPEVASNPRVVHRFQREMKMVGRLDHPNVVRAFDADRIGETLYIVMEYVPGQSLGQRYKNSGTMPAMDVVEYGAQAALGLAHAHDQGIVHRDIKPSNILLTDDRVVKVLDLGLGVLMEADTNATFATQDGIAVGTVDYMSPEQACGREVDGRSDIYSLGCSMYHLISGRLVFQGKSPIERLGARINGTPVPLQDLVPNLPKPLIEVMDRLLANKPQDRYQTAAEAAEALRAIVDRKSGNKKSTAQSSQLIFGTPATAKGDVAPKIVEVKVEVPVRVEVPVEPDYPAWFRPIARLAEQSPALALLAALAVLLVAYVLGIATVLLLRQ